MNDLFFELPARAQRLVRAIEATLAEAEGLAGGAQTITDATFSLRETRAKYLPQTLQAYVAIPPSQRSAPDDDGRSPEDQLMEQLSVLDRATRRDLETLAVQKRSDLSVNARFLAERFDDRSTEVSQPNESVDTVAVPAPELRGWLPSDTDDAKDIVAHVGKKFQQALPKITQFEYGGLWGSGRVESVLITLQQAGGTAFRYTLSAKNDLLQPSVTKLVHGVSIQTVNCSVGDWMQSLYDDLLAQAQHHVETRNALARLVR
ncbi:MAG TPA: hypothetical protein VIG51_08225 [Candidatus Baltobacteraceae bacterium]|jgi:hypothetical protein